MNSGFIELYSFISVSFCAQAWSFEAGSKSKNSSKFPKEY